MGYAQAKEEAEAPSKRKSRVGIKKVRGKAANAAPDDPASASWVCVHRGVKKIIIEKNVGWIERVCATRKWKTQGSVRGTGGWNGEQRGLTMWERAFPALGCLLSHNIPIVSECCVSNNTSAQLVSSIFPLALSLSLITPECSCKVQSQPRA